MNKKLADGEARRKIVEELDKTFFVEAGAGSGKTKSLVDRMIALLRADKCKIGTIAAVTFTRKAAAELRGRFQIELERAVANETDQAVRARLQDALQNLEQCYIGTIHSFCAKLLRERPIEIGLDPDFVEMEELEDDVFREQCWLEYLVKARLSEEEIMRGLEEAGLAPEDLRDAFGAVALYPEVGIVGGKASIPDYAQVRAALEKFLGWAKTVVPEKRPEKGYDGLQRLMLRCLIRQKNLGFDDSRLLMETFEILDKDVKITLNRWPSRERAQAVEAKFKSFRTEVVAPALKEWREFRQDKIVRFLRPVIEFFEARRKEENRLNFEDLLIHAARLLRENPEVRRYFSNKFTHLLVDEFQDTDPIQTEVLLYLKGAETEEKDWQKLRPKAGSLFLVGDPKQSIYRFRRADIDIYNQVTKIVEGAGGEALRLTTNFRSLGELAGWNNPVFRAVFPEKADQHQAAFALLETVRVNGEGCWSGVKKITAEAVTRNKGETIALDDAGKIADWIQWACCDGNLKLARSDEERRRGLSEAAQPSDFLILFRYKKHMAVYARALEERGIPFETTGSGAFADSEEITEITNLALALNDPENPIYAVAVLRGIFFGVRDEDLVEFKREGGRFNFAMPGRDIIQSKHLGAVRVSMALAKLGEWRRWTLGLPVSAALQRIFEDSGILNYYASLEMGSSRVGNVLKLLEIVRNEERKGGTAFAQIVKFLEELKEVRDIEEMSLTPARENAVRLMNLHKAKGLEAPVVFLANPVGIREHEVDKHVVRVGQLGGHNTQFPINADTGGKNWGTFPKGTPFDSRPMGYFAFFRRGTYQRKGPLLSQPVGWEEAARAEEQYQASEEIRLMYVAATRARNMLVVSTYAGNLPNKAWKTLDDALGDVPELEAQKSGRNREEREKLTLRKSDVEKAKKEILQSMKSAAEPSYAVETVTGLAKKERKLPQRQHETGLGLSWGRLVHQVLEAIGSGRLMLTIMGGHREESAFDEMTQQSPIPSMRLPRSGAVDKVSIFSKKDRATLELFIENLLAAEERDFSDKDRLTAHIESILGSPFWRRVLRAEKKYFEIPFSIKTDKGTLEATAGLGTRLKEVTLPVILSGTIDLVFYENGKGAGWVIADFKSDDVGTDPGVEVRLDDLVRYYAPQVRAYTRFWAEITGEPIKESGLYFTSINRWVSI